MMFQAVRRTPGGNGYLDLAQLRARAWRACAVISQSEPVSQGNVGGIETADGLQQ